jgi:hypothetical protein
LLHKIVKPGHVVIQQPEAGLMIGKMMTTLRTVLSAEEQPRRRHHKFKRDYEYLKLLKCSYINYFPPFDLLLASVIPKPHLPIKLHLIGTVP